MKRVVVSVISDLVSDQRVHKVSLFLETKGCDVLLLGRRFKNSPEPLKRSYQIDRIKCYFRKGILQYVEFNIKLFAKLLTCRADILVANDLDTLLPNYIVSLLRNKPLVYDSHEYFMGMPELKDRNIKRRIWKLLEKWILPTLSHTYTVNESISKLYKDEYGIDMQVVRNLPILIDDLIGPSKETIIVQSGLAQFPSNKKILVMQGAGINKDRGYEEAIWAMKYLPINFLLLIIGNGLILDKLKKLVDEDQLHEKVLFIPRVPYNELSGYTRQAFLGLSLDKPVSVNNEYSLPNKLFDYIHAEVPVLATGLVEIRKIVEGYDVGICIDNVDPQDIASAILSINENAEKYNEWKKNTRAAARELHWGIEIQKLEKVYDPLLTEINRS